MPRPLIDRAPGNDATSLTMYTTHSRASDTNIYNSYIIYNYIDSTPWKAIIGMAVQAIKTNIDELFRFLYMIIHLFPGFFASSFLQYQLQL